MVASLLCAREWLAGGSCIVVYGDVVFAAEHVVRLAASRHAVAIACDLEWRRLWEARFERPEEDAESCRLEGDRVVEIGARLRRLEDAEAQYTGLVKITPDGLGEILDLLARFDASSVDRLDTTALLAARIAAGAPVGAVCVRGRWCEVDRRTDLALYERKLARPGRWSHDWRA